MSNEVEPAKPSCRAMRDEPMWRKPDLVCSAGRGQRNTAGHADDQGVKQGNGGPSGVGFHTSVTG